MSDLIKRDDVIELIDRLHFKSGCGARKVKGYNFADGVEDGYMRIRSYVSLMPSVDFFKYGEWVQKQNVYGVAFCSNCDYELHTDDTNFCPNCGAYMRGNDNG